MIRRTRALLITMMIIAFSVAIVFAAQEEEIEVYNTCLVTNDVDATYIEGEVSKATGQNILVIDGLETVAVKTLPDTKKPASFRIKIPSTAIDKDRVNVFHLKPSEDEKGLPFGGTRVEISYKERNNQEIKAAQKKIEVTLPGEKKSITAKASSGENLMYSSSDAKIVEVKKDGTLVPKKEGTAKITIKQIGNSQYNSAEETIEVSVKELDAYSITFHSSDDNNKTSTQIVEVGHQDALNDNIFENGDHEFLGWATEDGGYVQYKDAEEVTDLAGKGENTDLYAVWTGDGAAAALAWAIDIANDDSFNYGTGSACHRVGCYFCGTNQRNKPRGYEKTYICLTFVGAAYAHGAEDPEILWADQNSKMPMYENESNFTRFSCWEKVGSCASLSVSDLEPGDVIIKYAADNGTGHVCMYAGDDYVVEALTEGWGPGSIAVNTSAAERLSRYGRDSRSYVMRYVGND